MNIVPELIQVFGWTAVAFVLTLSLTPIYLKLAKRFSLGKQIRTEAISGEEASIFNEMHAKKIGTPTMGGVIMWGSVLLIIALSRLMSFFGLIEHSLLQRGEVYLPLFTLITVGLLGAVDDFFNIRQVGGKKGIAATSKMIFLVMFAVAGAWWFFYKLDISTIHIPSVGDFPLGLWYIPLFILVIVSTANAVNITDGLDGLAGGLLILAYTTFGVIAFAQDQLILAIFCGLMIGSLMGFLWNNVPPALFYMGDTGSLAYGATLGVIAMMIDSVVVLIIVGGIFIVETLSVILQLSSKKCFKKKIFLVAPLHHHFEKKGWGEAKITMRFWIIGAMLAVAGLIVGLVGMGNH